MLLGLAALAILLVRSSVEPPSPGAALRPTASDSSRATASPAFSPAFSIGDVPPSDHVTPPAGTLTALDAQPARSTVGPMATPVTVPRSSQYSPAPLIPDAELGNLVASRLAGRSGRYGVAIKDLGSGRGVLINPDAEFEAASLFKLSVMYEVFKQRELGVVSFDEMLTVTERHVAFDLGTLDRPVGATIQIEEALERMITISDNSTAIMLTDRVGATNINRDLQGLGMGHTRLIADDLTTSPADMLNFFEMLASGQGVNAQASAEMLHLLSRQRVNDRIPRLLPGGAIVAHKTGNLPGVVNDAGIVYGPDASFVIAVLVQNTNNDGEAARIAAELAAAAYDHFRAVNAGQAPVAFPAAPPAPVRTPLPPATATPTIPASTPTEIALPTSDAETRAPTQVTVDPATPGRDSTPTPTALPSPTITSPTMTPTTEPTATTTSDPAPQPPTPAAALPAFTALPTAAATPRAPTPTPLPTAAPTLTAR